MQTSQLARILGTALLCSLLANALATTRNTTRTPITRRPTDRITVRPWWPPCRQPAICITRSPRVCGRTSEGNCRRFNNICELLAANVTPRPGGAVVLPISKWIHTRDVDCRTVRRVGAAAAAPCYQPCPRRRVVCPRTAPQKHICVSTRNRRDCKVLANNCQLINQNCHGRPRNNWLRVDQRQCGDSQLGDKPQPCVPLPTSQPTSQPTSRPTSRPTRRPTVRPSPRPTATAAPSA